MDLVKAKQALTTAGAAIAPLSNLDTVASFFAAAAATAPGAPQRAELVAARCGSHAHGMISGLLASAEEMPAVQALLPQLSPCKDMLIGTDRQTCSVCDGKLHASEVYTV